MAGEGLLSSRHPTAQDAGSKDEEFVFLQGLMPVMDTIYFTAAEMGRGLCSWSRRACPAPPWLCSKEQALPGAGRG